MKESSCETSLLRSLITLSKCGEWLDVTDQEIGDPESGASDRDICDIEDRPVRKLDEVHDMAVKELWLSEDPIGQVAEYATKEYAESNRPTRFCDLSREDDQTGRDDQGEDGKEDGEVGSDVEGGAAVSCVIEAKEIADDGDWRLPI